MFLHLSISPSLHLFICSSPGGIPRSRAKQKVSRLQRVLSPTLGEKLDPPLLISKTYG
jgi:hypothetical protein